MATLKDATHRKNARINAYDLIESVGYDKDMRPISEISDTGFGTTMDVIKRTRKEAFLDKVSFVCINNDSKNWCYLFDTTGIRVDMSEETIKK